jgi:hypothetical protein
MARIIIGLILWVISIVLTAWLFRSRGKSAVLGGLVGFLFSWLGLLVSLAVFMIRERRPGTTAAV